MNICIKSRGLSSTHDPYDKGLDLSDSVALMKTPLVGADGGTTREKCVIYLMYIICLALYLCYCTCCSVIAHILNV